MDDINSIIVAIQDACIKISNKVRYENSIKMSNVIDVNMSNDNVKKLDILSNKILIDTLSRNSNIKIIASEENDEFIHTTSKNGKYLVAFDPLDGSSNIDSNITIGTIFGIFKEEDIEHKKLGDSIVSAGYCLYGGSTQFIYCIDNTQHPLVNLLLLDKNNRFNKIGELQIPKKGNVYSINESNKNRWISKEKYNTFIETMIGNKYTQRWVGSLVADAHRTIIKGGIFTYPKDTRHNGRLRILYEAIPYCLIFECAGGEAYLTEELTNWRETQFPKNIHQKTPLILSSKCEMDLFKQIFT